MDNVYTTLSGKGQNPPEVFFYFPVSNPLYANLVTISESKMLWTLKFNPRPNKTKKIYQNVPSLPLWRQIMKSC